MSDNTSNQIDSRFVAQNIINQIGDLWHERIPSDEWVPVRQATNDQLDAWVGSLLASLISSAKRERDEAFALIEHAPHAYLECLRLGLGCTCWKSKLPSAALAEHDAEVWDACLDAIDQNELNIEQARVGNPYRATASRKETV